MRLQGTFSALLRSVINACHRQASPSSTSRLISAILNGSSRGRPLQIPLLEIHLNNNLFFKTLNNDKQINYYSCKHTILKGVDHVILKKFTSIILLITLLFTLTPFDYAANADDTDIALQLISSDAAFSSAENSAEPNDEALLLSDTILGSDGSDRVSYLSQGDNVLLSSNLNLSADATPDTLVFTPKNG